ncbi:magnesium and cobalt transport protein CorA [Lentzea sp. BCCO 10_0856]|uniref:Magnesium and cobalt transport protein CorA n=1 Tax=Lentzea miocenica TaxID=3095431 RepID=A0ABU4T288_9PSEU|nr:magnesium and cobalt transport protein CorA [Lentzea sp. BCCO 10_0856]MDX8032078.1 magnesium and cobalt transport protein CorA [Lentzea sp. BCCO 10_0856]
MAAHRSAGNGSSGEECRQLPSETSSIINNVVYLNGRHAASPATLADTFRLLERQPDSTAWIGLYRPIEAQLMDAATQLGLHGLAVEDAITAHQRPKLERYGDTLFVVLRSANYRDDTERVEFGELHLFVGPNFVLTVRHTDTPHLAGVRHRLEAQPHLLRLGSEAVLYAVLDAVVDGYTPVISGLRNDIEEIETDVFSRDPNASRRIYELSREVMEFQRATRPLLTILDSLSAEFAEHGIDEELQRHLRDVADHATVVVEQADGFRGMLADILAVNTTLVTQAQNEEMQRLAEASNAQNEQIKRISSWAAILFAPTLIGTIYGMNFRHMPELNWVWGYPFALLLMALVCTGLYLVFRRRGWL